MKQIIKSLVLAALLLSTVAVSAQTHYNLQVGSGTATNNYVPDYILFNYSYTQMLYTANEVGIDGTIDTIAFQSGTASGQTRTLTVYMAEVSQTNMANPVSETEFHQVFSGSVSWNSGWTSIALDTVFDYQDTGSLVIAVIDGTGSWVSSISFLGTTMSDTRSRYSYTDNAPYTLSSTLTSSTAFLPNVKLGISSYSTYCAMPSDIVISDITGDGATIAWAENGDAAQWEVIVSDQPVTDFDNAPAATTSNNPYTVYGLNGNTQYYVYVRANCDTYTNSGWTNAATFTTACVGYTSTPYFSGFEGLSSGDMPNCWEALTTGTSGSGTFPSAYVYSSNARTGSVYFEFESSTGQTEIAALPEMEDINTLQFDFYASCMNTNFVLEAGVIEDDSVFVTVDTVTLTPGSGSNWHNAYNLYTVYFDQYSGSGSRIALRVTGSGSYTLMVDDISVYEIPSCFAPTNFTLVGTGSDWATMSWSDSEGSNWEIAYDTTDFDPYNDNNAQMETASDTSVTLSGLVPAMPYTAYVRTNCGAGDVSLWVGPVTFVPGSYVMAANGTDTIYTCGTVIYDCGGNNGNYTNYNSSYLYVYPSDPTQVFSVSGFSTTESTYDYLRITDLTTGEVLFIDNALPNGQQIGPFTTYGGIELYFYSDVSNVYEGYQVFVSCTDAPSCLPVTGLHVAHLNVDSIVVAWTDTVNSGAEYYVEYRPAGTTTWSSSSTFDNYFVLDQLAANSSYDFRVSSVCSSDDTSVVSSIVTGRTLAAAPVDALPFNCNFEDQTVNDFWVLENGNETNAWFIGDSNLFISNDSAATNSYSTSTSSTVFAYVTMNLTAGDYACSYDWRAYGESNYDYIRVALVPASVDITAGNNSDWGTSTLPTGAYALDGGSKLNLSDTWNNASSVVTIPTDGTYKLVFYWRNDPSSGTQPPAAIDNVQFAMLSCSAPASITATSITSDAINLSWPAGDASEWVVTVGNNMYATTTNSYTLQNLAPHTYYTVSVRTVCGSDDTSFATTATFRTMVGDPLDHLPFICNFENATVNSNWVIENGSEANAWFIGNGTNNGGDSALYISNDNGTTNAYGTSTSSTVFAYVSMTLDGGDYVYSYDWQANGESNYDYIRVALVPVSVDLTAGNNSDWGTSTLPTGAYALDGGSKLNLVNSWQNYNGTVSAPAGTYNLVFYWRNDNSSGTQPPAAIDNVQFASLTCPAPTALVGTADSTEITVSWTPSGYENQWVVSNGTTTVVVNDTFYTFQNLTSATSYSITVSGICLNGDTSMSVGGTFSTTCGTFSLPFFEDFESPASIGCWQTIDNDFNSNSDWFRSSDAANSGSYGMATGYNSSTFAEDWLITPQLFLPLNTNGYYVEWNASGRSWSSDVTHMTVVVMTTDATDSTVVDTIYDAVVPDGWATYSYDISAYAGQAINVAFIYNGHYDYGIYLDDVSIAANPTCLKPTVMNAVCGLNDIQLSWNHGGTESAWEVSDGTTTVVVTDTFYTFQNLASATLYNFTVRAICAPGDSSYYLTGSFATLNSLPVTTLPYTCDFSGTEGTAWFLVNGTQTNAWYVDTAAHNGGTDNYGLYISSDNGATNSYNTSSSSVVFAYRTFTLAAAEYTYSFDWQAYGESSYDYLRVAMVPVSVDLTAGDNTGWSTTGLPAGAISLDGDNILNLNSSWTTRGGEFTITNAGNYNLVFFWRNDPSVGTQPPAAIDNVDIRVNSCPAINSMNVTASGTDFVTVEWNASSSATSWQLQYGESGFALGTGTTAFASTNNYTINNLVAMTHYDVWVRPVCGAGDTGLWRGMTVSTSFCDNPVVTLIGDTANYGAYTTNETPISTYYNYSLNQIIIDSAEIGGAMDIDAVEFFYYSDSPLSGEDSIDIYIQPTSKSTFDDEYDVVALDYSSAVHVFSGSFEQFIMGLNIVPFDTAYSYNGIGNLMMIVVDNSGVWNSSLNFVSVECDGNKTISYYDDYDIPDVSDPSTYDGSHMEVLQERPYMNLISCGMGCAKPAALVANAAEVFGTYNFSWSGSAPSYEVAIKSANEGVWPAETAVTTTNYSVSGLQPATTYTFRVRSVCDAGLTSLWTTVSFTTDSMPCFAPSNLQATATSLSSATLDWTVNGEETAWRVYVWNSGTQPISFDVTSHPTTVTGLTQNTSYFATVMALCGGVIESASSDTISFTTTACEPVTDAQVSNVQTTSATISWNGSAQSYTIEYGMGDFESGNGTHIDNITTTSYTIEGLTPDRSYSAYVRANCDANNHSVWSARITFRTNEEGIADIESMTLAIYPNPTSDNTTIALSGVNGEVTITIVDLSGRTVKTDSMSCEGDCVKTIAVSGLAEGAYFVRVNGENVNMVKKLVVK